MTDIVLGIDIGTSGVRIAATDSANTLIALSTAPIAAPVQAGLRILQDPAIWWTAVEAAMLQDVTWWGPQMERRLTQLAGVRTTT